MQDVTSADAFISTSTSAASVTQPSGGNVVSALPPGFDDSVERLADACTVLDVLGEGSRFTVLSWFMERVLEPYRMMFSPPGRDAGIEFGEVMIPPFFTSRVSYSFSSFSQPAIIIFHLAFCVHAETFGLVANMRAVF
jgi:hypothetical protein